jgi:hypothetical protein
VLLIVSGSFGQHLATVLDSLPQYRAVYLYCSDTSKHLGWAKQHNKIGLHRVLSQESDLLKQLTIDLKDTEQKVGQVLFSKCTEPPSDENKS